MKQYIQELEKKDNSEKREYLKNLLKQWDIPYRVQEFKTFWRKGENIIIDYPFSKKAPAGVKRILLSAHYDTVPWAPGANDNASGVAVLLELLRKLRDTQSAKTLRIVFFDLEDSLSTVFGGPPGSRAYIKAFGTADLECVYNLEMVGIGEVLLLWPSREEDTNSGWLKSLAEHAKEMGFPLFHLDAKRVVLIKFPAERGFVSDHISFIENGYQSVCSLTMVPQKDLRFKYILEGKNRFKFIIEELKYNFFGKRGDIPKLLRHYHNKDDRSEFVEEKTSERILELIWKTIMS